MVLHAFDPNDDESLDKMRNNMREFFSPAQLDQQICQPFHHSAGKHR